MIAILMTPTDSATQLEKEFELWLKMYGHPPTLILGHRDLVFSLHPDLVAANSDEELFLFRGVPIHSLLEFVHLHEEQLR